MEQGYGVNRRAFAYNYFNIVGPESDPAGIKGPDARGSVPKIRTAGMGGNTNVVFVSRGDNSGTHSAEKTIWTKAGFNYAKDVQNSGAWYIESGKGMGDTLQPREREGGVHPHRRGDLPRVQEQPQARRP